MNTTNFYIKLIINKEKLYVGGPEGEGVRKFGLHDRISNLQASIESIKQPDLSTNNLEACISGSAMQASVFGPQLQLRRIIKATLGQSL